MLWKSRQIWNSITDIKGEVYCTHPISNWCIMKLVKPIIVQIWISTLKIWMLCSKNEMNMSQIDADSPFPFYISGDVKWLWRNKNISQQLHSPASQFHIQRLFLRHGSGRTSPAHPPCTAHRSASHQPFRPCKKSGRVLLFHRSPAYPDTDWKGLFLFQHEGQNQSSEKPKSHLVNEC